MDVVCLRVSEYRKNFWRVMLSAKKPVFDGLCIRRQGCLRYSARLLPRPGVDGTEHGIDHGHVADARFERYGNFAAVAHRTRELVPLDRVLIADRQFIRFNARAEEVAAVIQKHTARAIGWRVEWNFDYYTPACSENLHALVGDELRATREDRLPRWEIQDGRGEPVDLRGWIAFDQTQNTPRLFPENKPRREDRITADIHQA